MHNNMTAISNRTLNSVSILQLNFELNLSLLLNLKLSFILKISLEFRVEHLISKGSFNLNLNLCLSFYCTSKLIWKMNLNFYHNL